jgi:hypothetical protein
MNAQQAKFELGQIIITPGAQAALKENGHDPWEFLSRHQAGDWGCLSDAEKEAADELLSDGWGPCSAYKLADGQEIWIDTKNDFSATTIILPKEYHDQWMQE